MTVDLVALERARLGDVAALASLLQQSQPDLRRYAQRSCLVSDVDDAVQEAMLVASRHVVSLRHPRAWSRWIFRIVRRACHRLARITMREDLWDDDRVDAIVGTYSEHGLRLDIAAAIESLPDTYREIVILRDIEGLTITECARRISSTRAGVKGRLHRARALIREYLVAN